MSVTQLTPFARVFAPHSSGRNRSPAPELVLQKPIFPCVLISEGVFSSDTLVGKDLVLLLLSLLLLLSSYGFKLVTRIEINAKDRGFERSGYYYTKQNNTCEMSANHYKA